MVKRLILSLFIVLSFLLSHGQLQKPLSEKLIAEIEENLQQSKSFEQSGDYSQAAFFLSRAATVYWVNGHPHKAVELFEKIIELNKKIGNLNALRTLYNNIGMIYADEEDYTKAIGYFNKMLDVSKQMNRKPDIAAALINIGNAQAEDENYKAAAKTLEEANALAKELNDEKLLRNCYSLLADVYEKMGNSEKSSEYFMLYTAISRKIQRDEMRQKDAEARKMVEEAKTKVSEVEQARQQTELELRDKQKALKETEENLEAIEQITKEQQMQIDLLNTEKELQDAIIRNQKLVRNVFVFIIFVVLAFAILFLYNLNIKKKANEKLSQQNKEIAEQKSLIEQKNVDIEKKNRDITASINYAQRIQQAMLPAPENLESVIPNSFILLKPRDIVSGDFYWFSGFASPAALKGKQRKNYIKLHNLCDDDSGFLISAVDCTGHGVPGAFMSLIGFNLLETVTRNGVVMPNEMLNELHRSVRYLLKQYNTDNRDGMDMAICSVKNGGRTVLYAGAKNPLIFISDGEVFHIKGDPMPVGGLQKESRREFTVHTINVDKPTSFYIYSDGFTDQFGGGSMGQKFGTKRFKELLLEIQKYPMKEQMEILEQRITEWMGKDFKQIDDIIIIGFKLGEQEIDV
jgi:serine phosphatase RsbU (regulator of sigma subunit)